MNDFVNFITELTSQLPINEVRDRNWIEIVSILAPSVLFISVLFGIGFSRKEKKLMITIYSLCLVLMLFFLPYELFRQASEISKADENINITQSQLKELLGASDLDHLEPLADKEVASDILTDHIYGLSDEQKASLIFMGWLNAENEKKIKQHIDGRYQSLEEEVKLSLNDVTKEVIGSRTPTDKISEDILMRINGDISQLIEQRMVAFNQEIDQSLGNFQEKTNSFVQGQLDEYEQTLANITQKNSEDLENYADQARIAFATQLNRLNKESLQKLEDTKKSIDDIGAELASANLKNLTDDVRQLSVLMEEIQQKNDVLFKYNECMRLVGLFDFSGEEEQCRKEMNSSLENL